MIEVNDPPRATSIVELFESFGSVDDVAIYCMKYVAYTEKCREKKKRVLSFFNWMKAHEASLIEEFYAPADTELAERNNEYVLAREIGGFPPHA